MKKKLLFLSIFLFALVFSSCNLNKELIQMTIVNNSTEVISSIEVEAFVAVNSKIAITPPPSPSNDGLISGQTVAVNDSVTFYLPKTNEDLYVKVWDTNDANSKAVYLTYDDNANFTLSYNGASSDFTISGDGARFEL